MEIGRCTNYLQKVIPARISNVRLFFVIRNSSGVQIFRNDEKARQRHLPKMYTLVVTMNWNRFRKMFRIRFCIFYNRSELSHWVSSNLSWFASLNNKAFGNLFCNPEKGFHTSLGNLPTRIIEAIDHSSNSTMAFAFTKNPRIFCKCKCHCWAWRMVDSLYYSSRKTSERCENSFVNYRIYYQKLCYSLRRIWTKPLPVANQ